MLIDVSSRTTPDNSIWPRVAFFGRKKSKTYRASVVMAWNLEFSDFLDRIYATGLAGFNTQVGTHNFRRPIQHRQDFADVKKSDILKICRAARLISGETFKTLEEKLGKGNAAVHPSTVVVGTATAEEVIFDLVENVL
jgi:hypothetical protein